MQDGERAQPSKEDNHNSITIQDDGASSHILMKIMYFKFQLEGGF
jgi:hypothetical protein